MLRWNSLSARRWARRIAATAAALFIFGGSLAYFLRFSLVIYYSYKLGLPNNLWAFLHPAAGG